MNEKNAYERKMRAEMASAQTRFAEFKAHAKHYTIPDHLEQHAKSVEDLELKVNAARARLQELEEADDASWEPLKADLESTLTDLQSTLDVNAFQAKINSELELVQIRFAEFKAQEHQLKDEALKKEHARHVEEFERKVSAAKARLKEMAGSDDDALGMVKDGVENIWSELQSTLEDTVTTFEAKK